MQAAKRLGEVKRSRPSPPEFPKYLDELASANLAVDPGLAYLATMVFFLTFSSPDSVMHSALGENQRCRTVI
eukprot:6491925-Amphidinium_carterae.1